MENYECVTYLCLKKTPMVSSDFLHVGFVILVKKQSVRMCMDLSVEMAFGIGF